MCQLSRASSRVREWRLAHLQEIIPPNDLAILIDLVESNVIPRPIGREILTNWFWCGIKKLKQESPIL